jgi:5-methylcytosine-specific restriction endonuclease McrA
MYKNQADANAKARELYKKNSEKYCTKNKEKREKRRELIYEALGNICKECGSKSNLEIDHINPGLKQNRVSPLSQGFSKTISELDNLRLLCKSCHSRRTHYQKNAAWNLFKSLPLEEQNKLIENQIKNPTKIS